MDKSCYRFYFQIRQSQRADALTIFDELKKFSIEHAPSNATVKTLVSKIKFRYQYLKDKPPPDAPINKF